MTVLFLSLLDFDTFDERNIYSDLLREFIKNGHKVCCISPVEKRKNQETRMLRFGENCILKLKIGNTQKVNLIEKGISTLRIEPLVIQGVRKYFPDVKFDLVLYATPPVTFAKVIRFVKKRDGAMGYLMLKDIFPQNSVDLGMLSKSGVKGLIYKYFRHKEKSLYSLSDKIGCMSQSNVDFVLKHNSDVTAEKVEVCPNSIDPIDMSISTEERIAMREKYGIPLDKRVFVYGGNLGKPQGIPFLIECLKYQANNDQSYFLIVGDGTEYGKLDSYISEDKPQNVKLMKRLPKEDYDRMVAACDVGMIFLDHRFTIPNFPSRLLSYMQAKLPVLCATDKNTDIGSIAVENGFGWWCESNTVEGFNSIVEYANRADLNDMGKQAWNYMNKNYTVDLGYKLILESIGGKQ